MKVIVYAIAKNESQFARRWYESMCEADEIYVLDTGSTDDTVDILRKLGVNVKVEEIHPWRFDKARNKSLEMVPEDAEICVCTDLDEIFEKGWRMALESKFKGYDRCRYNYIWSFDEYGKPAVNFYQEKIHTRNGYEWINPVHEVLKCNLENENIITIDDVTLKHYPDDAKSRSSYLPLLELAVKEDSSNDRNMHYLGREYMFHYRYEEAIKTLKYHLDMPTATWKDERCASMRFISRCYRYLKKYDSAIEYGLMAIKEAPYLREPYYELAYAYYELQDFKRCQLYLELALQIKENKKIYINEPNCYNGTIEDLLSICYYYLRDYYNALKYVCKALQSAPNNKRILKNKELILEQLN
jgi:glycosyltransferase involved in cell wall biosynthesis